VEGTHKFRGTKPHKRNGPLCIRTGRTLTPRTRKQNCFGVQHQIEEIWGQLCICKGVCIDIHLYCHKRARNEFCEAKFWSGQDPLSRGSGLGGFGHAVLSHTGVCLAQPHCCSVYAAKDFGGVLARGDDGCRMFRQFRRPFPCVWVFL